MRLGDSARRNTAITADSLLRNFAATGANAIIDMEPNKSAGRRSVNSNIPNSLQMATEMSEYSGLTGSLSARYLNSSRGECANAAYPVRISSTHRLFDAMVTAFIIRKIAAAKQAQIGPTNPLSPVTVLLSVVIPRRFYKTGVCFCAERPGEPLDRIVHNP